MADENRLFKVEIVSPDRVFYKGEATMIEFNTEDGEIGVYKNHIPLTTVLAPGIAKITEADGSKLAAIHAGFAEILPDKVTILAEVAEWPEEIDLERARQAKLRAEERVDNHINEVDVVRAEYALRKSLVRIEIKE